jgi:uncharacterized membrane protein
MARPVAGLGILLPALVPGCLAALLAHAPCAREHAPPVAFCAGVLGPLVGADLLHLRDLGRRGGGHAQHRRRRHLRRHRDLRLPGH